jgi:DNA-binding NtrC family response regulator
MCVLVVDDVPEILALLARRLKKAGHVVMTATNGTDAVRLLDEHPGFFTGLVTDYHMSLEVTGGHLIEQMRHRYPKIPMVLSTGFPDVVTPEWLTQNNVTMLRKPYSIKRLLEVVEQSL